MNRLTRCVAVLLCLVLSASAFAAQGSTTSQQIIRHPNAIPSEYLVGLAEGIELGHAHEAAIALARKYGVTVLYVFDVGFAGFHCRATAETAQRLAKDPHIAWVEENSKLTISAAGSTMIDVPDGNTPAAGGSTLGRITRRLLFNNTNTHYNYASGGAGVLAYIVDTGVYAGHNEFGNRVKGGADIVTPDSPQQLAPCATDTACTADKDARCLNGGHGTAVASMLGGAYLGVAPEVEIIPIRVSKCDGTSDMAAVTKGLTKIVEDLTVRSGHKGAVVTMSMENPTAITGEGAAVPSFRAVLRAVINAGAVVFVAAGNNPEITDTSPSHNPIGTNNGDSCNNYPAHFSYGNGEFGPHVITVSGTLRDDRRCVAEPGTPCGGTQFSYGQCIDLFAPAYRVKAAHFRDEGSTAFSASALRLLGFSTGTSFAAPQAAGAAARLLSELNLYDSSKPWLTSDRVFNALRANTTPDAVDGPAMPQAGYPPALYFAPNRLLYVGGATISKQPAIVGYESNQVVIEAQAKANGGTPVFQWYQARFIDHDALKRTGEALPGNPQTPGLFSSRLKVLRHATDTHQYWARVTETVDGVSVTSDSALVTVTPCSTPTPTIPTITVSDKPRVNGAFENKKLLQVNVTGTKYRWYKGYSGDTTEPVNDVGYPEAPTSTDPSSIEVLPDMISLYWVRVFNEGCTVDSATVEVAGCNLGSDVTVSVLGAKMKDPGETDIPSVAGTKDARIALTPSISALPPYTSIEWRDGATTSTSLTYQAIVGDSTRQIRLALINGSCENVRVLELARVITSGCTDSLLKTTELVLPPSKPRVESCTSGPNDPPGVEKCGEIYIDYDKNATRVEWRRGNHDDRAMAESFDVNQNPTTRKDGRSTIKALPGETYWARVIGSCGGRYIHDSELFRIPCDDCTLPTNGVPKCDGKVTTACQQGSAGASMELKAPDNEISGAQYEWRSGDGYNLSAEPFARSYMTTRTQPGKYWVRTVYPNLTTVKNSFHVEVLRPDPDESDKTPRVDVTVIPDTRFIPVDGTARVTAQAKNFCEGATIEYQWFSSEPQSGSVPISTEYERVHVTPPDTFTEWVRAKGPQPAPDRTCDPDHPIMEPTPAVPVTITVVCNPSAHVAIGRNPLDPHIAKDDLVGLSALGVGKKVVYNWFQGPEGDDANSTLIAHGPGLLRQPANDTSYWVRVEDSCGNTDTEAITLYVCKPVIAPLPETLYVTAGGSEDINANVLGGPGQNGNLEYRWYRGDPSSGYTAIPDADTSKLTVREAGDYYVTVTGRCADNYRPIVNSTITHVIICNPPQIHGVSGTTVASGQNGAISVSATGLNLTYQWYRGEQLLPGEIAATLVDHPSATTTYRCVVTSDGHCSTPATATIEVCAPPVITTQPQPKNIRTGQTAQLNMAATGATGYQWYFAGNPAPITDATSTTFTTLPLTQDTAYNVRATNGPCTTESNTVMVTVCSLDVLLTTTRTQITPGESATLTAAVSNQRSQELYYSWYKGNSGNTDQLVTQGPGIASYMAAPSSTTYYWVRVSDGTCTIDSPSLRIEFCTPPHVVTHPVSQLLDKTQNSSASKILSVAATGDGLTYQWYIGERGVISSPIPNETSTSISVSPDQPTKYWVRVSGQCGTPDDSNAAEITLCVPPAITTQPASKVTTVNTAVQLEVTASGTGLNYGWYKGAVGDTTTPVGTSSAVLTVTTNVTSQYWVRVTGTCGSINSTWAVVSVTPVITTQPVDRKITKNTAATFSVAASGSSITYQWYQGSTAIPGATGASYTTPALNTDASYFVRLTSGYASVDSSTVWALICQPKSISVSQPSQNAGSAVTLSVVSPDPNETYAWYRGNSGDTTNYLGTNTALVVNPDITTNYWFRSTGYGCYADSAASTVVTCAPRITQQPAAASVVEGNASTLQVAAAGNAPLAYKWYEGQPGDYSRPVLGGDAASISPAPATTTTYFAKVTSGTNCVTNSNAVVVTVCNLPRITAQPSPVTTALNATANLTVSATGTALQYQWYRGVAGDTSAAVGINSATLAISPVVATYDYWVRVSGQCGSPINSQAAKISIPPALSAPATAYVASGQSATFTVTASGNQLSYQWYQGSTAQSNGTAATFTTPALTADTNYWVRVYSGNAYADSGSYQVLICTPRDISVYQPSNVSGSAVTLSVTPVSGESYAWYQGAGGTQLLSQNTQVTISPDASTTYTLRTTRGSCYADRSVTVYVCVPRMTAHPQSVMVNPGQTATVSVSAVGTGPLSYQWYAGNAGDTTYPISQANASSYSWQPSGTTSVWARVWSAQGGSCYVNSNAALVELCQPAAITAHPQSSVIYNTDTVTLSVSATGTQLTYQWYENTTGTNVTLTGATASTFVIQPGSTRSFWVRVTGRCGTVDSQVARLSVRPVITSQPANTSACAGGTANFSVAASGANLEFRWYPGPVGSRTQLLGTAPTLSLSISSTTSVWCEIWSYAASVSTQLAAATVQSGPAVGIAKTYMGWGWNYALTASVSPEDAGNVTYAWYRGSIGDTSVPAGGSQSIMVYAETSTWYWVRVTNGTTGCYTDQGIVVPW